MVQSISRRKICLLEPPANLLSRQEEPKRYDESHKTLNASAGMLLDAGWMTVLGRLGKLEVLAGMETEVFDSPTATATLHSRRLPLPFPGATMCGEFLYKVLPLLL
jgi:hypothetical protein